MFIDVGRTVNFICSVIGYPEPIVTWYRDGIELHPANDRRIRIRYGADVQSLIITNVERSDSGQYLCRAENRFGQAATTAALVVAGMLDRNVYTRVCVCVCCVLCDQVKY